jgi:hypothetical protein
VWIAFSPSWKGKESLRDNYQSRRASSRLPFSLTVVSLLFLFLAGSADPQQNNTTSFSQFRPRREIPGEAFVGSERCATCHIQKTRSQLRTAMAHALRTAVDSDVLRTHPRLTFQSGSYSFQMLTSGGQTTYRVTNGREALSVPILYAFGHAHVAQTYVFERDSRLYETRVSYYTGIDGLDWTIGDVLNSPPNLEEAAGRDIGGDESRNCFSCHGTGAVVNNKLQLDRLAPGVGCEACHGPAGRHSAAMASGMDPNFHIFNPKDLDPESLSQEFCGACHRSADAVAMMPDLGGINNVRFQPYRMANSRGHNPSDEHFACTACHDPHLDLPLQSSSDDAKCTMCHAPRQNTKAATHVQNQAPAGKPANVSATAANSCPVSSERCMSCHMPKIELPGAHFRFTDHRIRIARPGVPYPQ